MSKERRKSPRKKFNEKLKLDNVDGAMDGFFEAQTIDISKSGALCLLNMYIAPFTKLNIKLPLAEIPPECKKDVIECESVVVRVEPTTTNDVDTKYKVALFFMGINEVDKEKLENFLKTTH
jgi:hypothetical protein